MGTGLAQRACFFKSWLLVRLHCDMLCGSPVEHQSLHRHRLPVRHSRGKAGHGRGASYLSAPGHVGAAVAVSPCERGLLAASPCTLCFSSSFSLAASVCGHLACGQGKRGAKLPQVEVTARLYRSPLGTSARRVRVMIGPKAMSSQGPYTPEDDSIHARPGAVLAILSPAASGIGGKSPVTMMPFACSMQRPPGIAWPATARGMMSPTPESTYCVPAPR